MLKKTICALLTICMLFALFPVLQTTAAADNSAPDMSSKKETNTSDSTSRYTSDWRYWSQGASRYYNKHKKSKDKTGMREAGCRVVAQAKLLVEAGIAPSDVNEFNPDIYFEWGNAEGYFGSKGNLYSNIGEKKPSGSGVLAYAKALGVEISFHREEITNKSVDAINSLVMDYLRDGSYVILCYNDPHHAYVGREESLLVGKPVIWDSWGGWSYSPDLRRVGAEKANGKEKNIPFAIQCYKVTNPAHEYVLNQCTQYPTSVKLSVVAAGSMMSLPCEGRTYGESVAVTPLTIGSTYTADSLVVNSAGNCWYAVRYNGKTGYIYCGDVTVQPPSGESISFSDIALPVNVRTGKGFGLRGELSSSDVKIKSLVCSVYPNSDLSGTPVLQHIQNVNGYSLSVKNSDLNTKMKFGSLPAGDYTLTYDVYTEDYYAANNSVAQYSNHYTIAAKSFSVSGAGKDRITVSATAAEPYIDLADASSSAPAPEPTATPAPSAEEPVQKPAQKPSISVSGNNTPGSLQQGGNFGIRGTVYTDCGMITELYGAIYDSNGNAVQTSRHSPNVSSVNLRYTINNDLVFGNLGAGSYTYYVEATAVNGGETATNTVIYDSFNVYSNEPEQTPAEPPQQPVQNPAQKPSISVSGNNTPGSLQQGSNFGIRGTVYTDCGMITALYGAIYDSNGNAVQTSRHSPNASSADLRYTINNDLVFGNLGAGSYTYYVEATAVNGGETTTSVVINDSFNVYSNQPSLPQTEAPSVDEPELDSVDCYMTVNVGADSTLRFCSTVSVADQYELGSICNDVSVYVYGTTKQQYEDRTWAKINYDGRDGWVNYKWLAPQADAPASSCSDVPYPIDAKECWMTVNVGQGSTLSFRSDVYVEESTKICTLRDGTSIYVYGTTTQQYNGITWARVNYNNQDGWVDYKWLA